MNMQVRAVSKFERFFRVAASLDVDKEDLRRYSDFIKQKIHDLLIRGQANASANDRDIIEPFDLPITKGLQQSIHDFRKINEKVDLKSVLDELTPRPVDLSFSQQTEEQLGFIAGGISVALARTFKYIDSDLKNPQTEHWERATSIFNQLL